jgi:UDP-glucose 4-epimerase
VTGANGFVGTHLVRKLMRDHDVLAVDNLRYGPWRFSDIEMGALRSDTTDLRDARQVRAVIEGYLPDVIIHLAAIHFIPECEQSPDEAIATNVQGTVNLLAACPQSCSFVYTSTAAVYAPKDTPHDEKDPIGPVDVYGFTKWHGEDFVRYFSKQRDLRSVIVRLFNVIGPGETNPHVLPEIIRQLKAGRRVLRLGNTHPKRDYIDVRDVTEGFIAAALKRPSNPAHSDPMVVNLGSGKSFSVAEVIDHLSQIIGADIGVEVDEMRIRPVDRLNLVADNSRMRGLFAWESRYGIREALRNIWANPDLSLRVVK